MAISNQKLNEDRNRRKEEAILIKVKYKPNFKIVQN